MKEAYRDSVEQGNNAFKHIVFCNVEQFPLKEFEQSQLEGENIRRRADGERGKDGESVVAVVGFEQLLGDKETRGGEALAGEFETTSQVH